MMHFRRMIFLFLLFFCLITSISAAPALAHNNGDGSPPHSVRGVLCEYIPVNGQVAVKAFPPNHATAWWGFQDDVVYWTPLLYRWNGSEYIEWIHPPTAIASAYVNPYGFDQGKNPGWRHITQRGPLQFHPFYGLPSGTYTVMHSIEWLRSGHVHYEWAPDYCSI